MAPIAVEPGATPARIGQRLSDELQRNGWTVKHLLGALRAQGARVSGQTAVYGYVRGESDWAPPAEFIEDAATVFGIRVAYLLVGHGERTEEDERTRIEEEALSAALVTGAELGRRWTAKLSDALEQELGGRIPKVAHVVVAHHWRRLHVVSSHVPSMRYSGEDLLRKLAKALVDPLREFDDSGRWTPQTMGALSEEQRGDYLMGIVPAVATALEHRFRAEGTEILMKTLAMKGLEIEEEDTDA